MQDLNEKSARSCQGHSAQEFCPWQALKILYYYYYLAKQQRHKPSNFINWQVTKMAELSATYSGAILKKGDWKDGHGFKLHGLKSMAKQRCGLTRAWFTIQSATINLGGKGDVTRPAFSACSFKMETIHSLPSTFFIWRVPWKRTETFNCEIHLQ